MATEKNDAAASAAATKPPAADKPATDKPAADKPTKKKKEDLGGIYLNAFEDMLIKEGAGFIKNNAPDVEALGEDVVLAILAQQVEATIPTIIKLTTDASMAMIAESSSVNASRDRGFQLVAKAERENAARVARIRGNASVVAAGIARNVIGLAAGFAFKTLTGL